MQTQSVWQHHVVDWKRRDSWVPSLSQWLGKRLCANKLQQLADAGGLDLCWDDSEWLEVLDEALTDPVAEIEAELGDAITSIILRSYHACRVADAGVFYRDGLRVNDPDCLEAEARRIVAEESGLAWMRPRIDQTISDFKHRKRDIGCLYVCADDRPALDHSGHYALYGSEWLQVLLGSGARPVLRKRGVPTVIEIDLPFSWAHPSLRDALARDFLQEWTRNAVNAATSVPELDFSVSLHRDIPLERIVGHHHPAVLKDPFDGFRRYVTETIVCPACETRLGI